VDLYDPAAVRTAIAGFDAIVRLTTKISSIMKIRAQSAWDETNRLRTEGARILVDAAIAEHVGVYVHESVTFVYRDGGDRWLDEESPLDEGGSAIMRATLEGERQAARFSDAGGRGIVLRFAALYGEDAPSTQEMIQLIKQRKLPEVGPGSNYFSSVYLPDAGRAIAEGVSLPAGIYNVVDDEPVSFAAYLRALVNAVGAPKPIRLPGFLGRLLFGQTWNYFSRSQRVSNAKLKCSSGWVPEVRSVIDGWPRIASDHSHSMVPGGLWVRS
jgi:NAD dependent epimerase/dehydratase family enzyme